MKNLRAPQRTKRVVSQSTQRKDNGLGKSDQGAINANEPYHQTQMNIAVAEGISGGEMVKYQAVLSEGEPADAHLAIGDLPKGWKPVQPTHINLIFVTGNSMHATPFTEP